MAWDDCHMRRVVVFVGIEIGVRVKLVKKDGVSHVKMWEGHVGREIKFAGGYVEEAIGKMKVRNFTKWNWRLKLSAFIIVGGN